MNTPVEDAIAFLKKHGNINKDMDRPVDGLPTPAQVIAAAHCAEYLDGQDKRTVAVAKNVLLKEIEKQRIANYGDERLNIWEALLDEGDEYWEGNGREIALHLLALLEMKGESDAASPGTVRIGT